MRSRILAVATLAALAACSNASDEGADDEAAGAEAETPAPQQMLPNGAPAYPGIDLSAVADQGVNGSSHTVSFETGASPDEVYDFYRTAYLADDYAITSTSINVQGEEIGTGGSLTVGRWGTDGARATVSPRGEQTEFDLTKEYGEGFPAYPHATADTVQEQVNGDYRSVSFESTDSIADIFDFYRNALRQNYQLQSLSLSVESRTMRRSASISISGRYNADGARVSVTNYDPSRENAAGGQ